MANAKDIYELVIKAKDEASTSLANFAKRAKDSLGDAEKSTGRFGGMIDKAAERFPKLGNAMDKAGVDGATAAAGLAAAWPAAAATAGTAVAAFVAKSVAAFNDQAQAVKAFRDQTGLAAEDSSRLVAVLDDFQVSSEAGAATMVKFARNIATNDEAFAKWNVQVVKAKDGTTDMTATFANAIDMLSKQTDATKRAEMGTDLFGRQWTTIAPLIEAGADDVRAALEGVADAQIFDDADIRKSEEYRLALDELSDAWAGVQREVGEEFIPVMTDAINLLNTLPLDKLGDGLTVLLAPMTEFSELMDNIFGDGDILAGIGEHIAKTEELTTAKAAAAQIAEDQANAEEEAAKAQKASEKAANDLARATRDAEAARQSAIDAAMASMNAAYADAAAQDKVTDATKAAAEAYGRASQAGFKDADANRAAAEAARDAGKAMLDKVASTVRLAREQAEANGVTLSAAEAEKLQRAELEKLRQQFPTLNGPIDDYIAKLNSIPRRVVTVAGFEGNVSTGGGGTVRKMGGPIPGGRDEPVPITAHGGEYVLDAGTVDAIKQGRPSVGSATGRSYSMGSGGSSGGGSAPIVINVHGTASAQQAGEVVSALESWIRRNGKPDWLKP